MTQRISMMGCLIDNLTMEETLQRVAAFIGAGTPHQHVVVNVDKLVKASRDPALRRIINECDLVSVDGMPVLWAARLLGHPLKARVTGIDLFEALMQRAAQAGWRVFLLGARDEVVAAVQRLYEHKYRGLAIAGCHHGYFTPEQERGVADQVAASGADLLFVAIGSPAKEQFLARWQAHMRVPFAMGVGGSFDVAAGLVRRAPAWMQHSGLEWFYRFLQEPRRMFRRYFIDDMAFIWLFLKEAMRRSH